MSLPFEPLLTIERSSLPEVTIYGAMAVVDGEGRSLISLGDQEAKFWTRSCLKPWQLLNHLHVLRKHYPQLSNKHYALMLSSHSGQKYHLEALDEIETIGGTSDADLQNTPLYPINPNERIAYRAAKLPPCSRWGSCSGKHMGFIMALKAQHEDASKYLDPNSKQFVEMRRMLAHLLQIDWHDIPQTTDGCRLPNYAFKPREIARLYNQLARPYASLGLPQAEADLQDKFTEFDNLKLFMGQHPEYVGGDERFDTELMQGKYTDIREAFLLAKEGADGVLTIGVAPCKRYPSGLGIMIKSSSGDDPRYFTLLALEVLDKLELLRPEKRRENKLKHLSFNYHFDVKELANR